MTNLRLKEATQALYMNQNPHGLVLEQSVISISKKRDKPRKDLSCVQAFSCRNCLQDSNFSTNERSIESRGEPQFYEFEIFITVFHVLSFG